MLSFKKKLSLPQKKLLSLLVIFVVVGAGVFLKISNVQAAAASTAVGKVASAVGSGALSVAGDLLKAVSPYIILAFAFNWILYVVAAGLSWIAACVIMAMIYVLTWPIDINGGAVNSGWVIVRDVCNNFFIVILMVVAVATVLRIQSWPYRQILPKLLIAAVLINFSKMICGIMIDVAQILMLTFAAPLSGITGGGIILATVGLPDLFNVQFEGITSTLATAVQGSFSLGVTTSMLYAVIVAFVLIVVVGAIIMVLVYRLITLLFLTILSPIAFILNTFQKGSSYASQWWDMMIKNLIVGPIMIFFLWLSFMMMGYANGSSTSNLPPQTFKDAVAGLTSGLQPQNLIKFCMVIGMLVASLMMGVRTGAAGTSWARAGMSFLDKQRKRATAMPWRATKAVGTAVDDRLNIRSRAYGAAYGVLGRTPFIGAALANRANTKSAATLKREQGLISDADKQIDPNANRAELIRMSKKGNRYQRIASMQRLVRQGHLSDPDLSDTERDDIRDSIQSMRSSRVMGIANIPEFKQSFDETIAKTAPAMALNTVYRDSGGNIDMGRLRSDLFTGKTSLSKMLSTADEKTFNDLDAATASTGGIISFLQQQAGDDTKELSNLFRSAGGNNKIRDRITEEIDKKDSSMFADSSGVVDADKRDAVLSSIVGAGIAFDQKKFFNSGDDKDAEHWKNFMDDNAKQMAKIYSGDQLGSFVDSGMAGRLSASTLDSLGSRSEDAKNKINETTKKFVEGFDAALVTLKASGASADEIEKVTKLYAKNMENGLLNGIKTTFSGADQQNLLDRVMTGKKGREVREKMHSDNINENFVMGTTKLTDKEYQQMIDSRSISDVAKFRTVQKDVIDKNKGTPAILGDLVRRGAYIGAEISVGRGGAYKANFEGVVPTFTADHLANNETFDDDQLEAIAIKGDMGAIKGLFTKAGGSHTAQKLAEMFRNPAKIKDAASRPAVIARAKQLKAFI